MSLDYEKRDDNHARVVTAVSSDAWGFAKATAAMTAGLLASPDNTAAKDRGPAYGSGSGEADGGTVSGDYAFDDIASGDWIVWERKNGKVYFSLLFCPDGA
jgi:hypothetical protein